MPVHHPPVSMDEEFGRGKLKLGADGFDLPSGMLPVPRLLTLNFIIYSYLLKATHDPTQRRPPS